MIILHLLRLLDSIVSVTTVKSQFVSLLPNRHNLANHVYLVLSKLFCFRIFNAKALKLIGLSISNYFKTIKVWLIKAVRDRFQILLLILSKLRI